MEDFEERVGTRAVHCDARQETALAHFGSQRQSAKVIPCTTRSNFALPGILRRGPAKVRAAVRARVTLALLLA